jgi:hypothetical protein
MGETHRKSSLIAEVKRRKVVVVQDLLLLLNGAVRRNPHGVAVVSSHQPHLGLPGIAIKKKPDQLRWTHSQSETGAKALASCLRERVRATERQCYIVLL